MKSRSSFIYKIVSAVIFFVASVPALSQSQNGHISDSPVIVAWKQKLAEDSLVLSRVEVGTIHSPKAFGVSLELPDDAYHSSDLIEIMADMHGLWDGMRPVPGFKLSYVRNVFLSEFTVDKTVAGSFYVGPGISMGYVRDADKPFGFMAGVSAAMGVKLLFPNRLAIYFEFGTDFGLFVSRRPRMSQLELSFYQSGLLNFYYPQLRIAYSIK